MNSNIVSRETKEKFAAFKSELIKWNNKINLISKYDIDQIEQRHIKDSMQIADLIFSKNDRVIDFGTGAGFPGIVLAILGYDVTLVESDSKKIIFLENIKNLLQLDCLITHSRIEKIKPDQKYDIITARALAKISKLLEYSHKFIHNDIRLIFLKGNTVDRELEEAQKYWNFDYKKFQSKTDIHSYIVEIVNIGKIDDK